MSKVSYKQESPYVNTQQSTWYLKLYQRRYVFPDITDEYMEITNKYHLRPDLMSYDLYGTTDYWWVLMERNIDIIRDPIFDFTKGKKIWVPSVNRIKNI
jgi:hypothetical protein